MRKVITKIRPNQDNYQLTHIDCFEKPIGIALDGVVSGYSSIFYMNLKLFSTYNFFEVHKSIFDLCDEIFPRLSLELRRFKTDDEEHFATLIQKEIDNNNPVLVPGNLNELYYSSHYNSSDWGHLFVITGYDDKNELFFIIDGAQKKSSEHRYEEFVIPYHILIQMYRSFKAKFEWEHHFFSIVKLHNEVDLNTIYMDSLEIYLHQRLNQPYRELYILEEVGKMADPPIDSVTKILNENTNYKEVFFNEFLKYLRKYTSIEQPQLDAIENQVERLLEEWRKVINLYVVNLYREKHITLSELLKVVLEYERGIEQCFQDIYERRKFLVKHSNGNLRWIFENNQEGVIHEDHRSITFRFHNSKVYNAWISDEAPKALLNQDLVDTNFNFSCYVSVEDKGQEIDYHGGILFRTVSNELYFWGIHRGDFLILQKIGDDRELSKVNISSTELSLELQIIDDRLLLKYGTEEEHRTEIYQTTEINRIEQIGVGCKTWGKYKELELTFSNPHFIAIGEDIYAKNFLE